MLADTQSPRNGRDGAETSRRLSIQEERVDTRTARQGDALVLLAGTGALEC